MKSRTVFGIFVCGIFDILGWIFGVWHNRGCPRIFPEGQPAEIIVRIFKNSWRIYLHFVFHGHDIFRRNRGFRRKEGGQDTTGRTESTSRELIKLIRAFDPMATRVVCFCARLVLSEADNLGPPGVGGFTTYVWTTNAALQVDPQTVTAPLRSLPL